MPHEPGHVFDPFNLSPAEEKARRFLRQAQDALAPAAMAGELGERGVVEQFLVDSAEQIKEFTGATQQRITDPGAFGAFLAARSDDFEDVTGQPSPFRQALMEEDRIARGRPDRPSPFNLIPGAIPLQVGERIGKESFAQLAAGFQPGNIGGFDLGGPTIQLGPSSVPQRAQELEAEGLSSFAAATQSLAENRGNFPNVNLGDISRLLGGGRGGDIGPDISTATLGEIALDPLNLAPATLIERGAITGAVRAGGALARPVAGGARRLTREGAQAAGDVLAPRRTVSAFADAADVGSAQTGQPFRAQLFRGSGRAEGDDILNPILQGEGESLFGSARYSTPNQRFAAEFGPNVQQVETTLQNPLVIRTDVEYARVIEQAGLPPTFMGRARLTSPGELTAAQNNARIRQFREFVEGQGHDGIIIDPAPGDLARRMLEDVSEAQVVEFNPQVAGRAADDVTGGVASRQAPRQLPRAAGEGIVGEVEAELLTEELVPPRTVAPVLKQTPAQATRTQTPLQTQDPRISSVVTDSPAAQLERDVAALRAERVAAGGAPPRRPLGNAIASDGSTPPPRRTDVGLSDDLDIPVHEQGNIRQTLFRKFEGANNIEALEMEQWFRAGTRSMTRAGIRQFDEATMRPLFEALHGERSVDTLTPAIRSIFDDLDQLRRAEEVDMLDFLSEAADQGADSFIAFDAENLAERFMANPDYFPRLWKPRTTGAPGRAQVGGTPTFARGRVDATFGQLLDGDAARGIEGLEPATWNPYKMMANRRINGVKFRETTVLLNRLKQNGKALPSKQAPDEGWRVPDIGPAFKGRPFANPDGSIGFSDQIATPNSIAKQLEDVFGNAQLLLGENVAANGFRQLVRTSKRLKLAGSFFQHVDFATRAAGTAFTPTGISRGAPLKFPSLIKDMFSAQWLPSQRRKLTQEILSDESFFNGRTGNILRGNRGPKVNVTSRMMVEEGWAVNGDITFIKRGFLDELNRMEQQGGLNEATLGNIRKAAEFFEAGLFDGVYRTTHRWALKNFIIPEIARRRPGATARQIAAEAADNVNLMFSSVERWQSVIKDPALRDGLQQVIFSTNEQEGLIRTGIRAFRPLGKNGSAMLEWYGGLFIAMAAFGNLINFAATGELLSPGQYNPINFRDPFGGFSPEEIVGTETERGGINLGYNRSFLSPILPGIEGEGGQPVRADLVGQMDTIFSWALDPFGATSARLNVPIRAVQSQVQGEGFGGVPVLTREDRAIQLASDIAAPISVVQAANALNINPLEAEFERRVGGQGAGIQALTGINIRAISNEDVEARSLDESLTPDERAEAANELVVRESRSAIRRLETALAGNPSEERRPGMERDLEAARARLAAAEGRELAPVGGGPEQRPSIPGF